MLSLWVFTVQFFQLFCMFDIFHNTMLEERTNFILISKILEALPLKSERNQGTFYRMPSGREGSVNKWRKLGLKNRDWLRGTIHPRAEPRELQRLFSGRHTSPVVSSHPQFQVKLEFHLRYVGKLLIFKKLLIILIVFQIQKIHLTLE